MELSRIILKKFVKYLNILKQNYFLLTENSCFHKTATKFTSAKFKIRLKSDIFIHAKKQQILQRLTKSQTSKPKQEFKLNRCIKKVLNDEVKTRSVKSYATIDAHSCSETSSIFDDEIRVKSNFSHDDDCSSFKILTTSDILSTQSTPPDAFADPPGQIFTSRSLDSYISNTTLDQEDRNHKNLSSWSNSSYDIIALTENDSEKASKKFVRHQRGSPSTSLSSWTSFDSSISEQIQSLTPSSTPKLMGFPTILKLFQPQSECSSSYVTCSQTSLDLNLPEQNHYSKNDAIYETKSSNTVDN